MRRQNRCPLFFFWQFDTNGDGEISTTELREAMKKLLGQQVGHRDIEDIIRDVDLNGDGRVDFEGERKETVASGTGRWVSRAGLGFTTVSCIVRTVSQETLPMLPCILQTFLLYTGQPVSPFLLLRLLISIHDI